MTKRKSFIIHIDSLNILDELSDDQAGKLFKAIKSHQEGVDFNFDALTKVAFSPFKNQFIRDDDKYLKLCEKNRLIAEKRYCTKSTNGKSGNQPLPTSTKSTDNDSKSDSKSKNDSDSKVITNSRFTPPTDIETVSYFESKGSNNIEAEKFWNFYDSKNWMVGKNKMKKWQSAARGWITRNTDKPKKSAMQLSTESNWHEEDLGL